MKECIELSRNFVCVRIDPYETQAHADWVRKLWRGALSNTVFTLFEPDCETTLCRSGRSPGMVFGETQSFFDRMEEIAKDHKARADIHEAVVPDFLSFRQALNTASCDERPLVLISAPSEKEILYWEKKMRKIVWHKSLTGCFHWDLVGDTEWKKVVSGSAPDTGVIVIKPDKFGLKGSVIAHFKGTEPSGTVVKGLQEAFFAFQKKYEAKVYESHVREGRRSGVSFPQELEQKEDRK